MHDEALHPLARAGRRHAQVERRAAAIAVEARRGTPDKTVGEIAGHCIASSLRFMYRYIYSTDMDLASMKRTLREYAGIIYPDNLL